jgi:hypothetical protein
MEAIVAKAQNQLERVALVAFGWILTLVGILGLFIPIMPGVFLIVAGALIAEPWECVAAAGREMSSEVSGPGSPL